MSLAHNRAAMTLECKSRQAFGKEVSWLIFTGDFVELDVASCRQLPDTIDTCVDVLGSLIHAGPLN